MAVEVLSKVERVGFLQQSKVTNAWAAPAAANAAFKTIQWINAGTPNPNPSVTIDNINSTSQYGVHREFERFFVDKTSGLPTLPITGIADKTTFAGLIMMALQGVTEAATTPFSKSFTYASTVLDWATNEGYLFTVAIDQKASADDGIIIENCLMQNLNLIWDLNANGIARCLQYNGTIIGNEINYEQTLSGTWTNATPAKNFYNTTDTFSFTNLTINLVEYASAAIKRFELQFNNNIFSDNKTTGGKANQYKWKPEMNAIIRIAHDTATEKIYQDYQDGVTVYINFGNDISNGVDKNLSINGYGIIQSCDKVSEGDYIGIDLNIQIQSVAGAAPLAIALTDAIDWGF